MTSYVTDFVSCLTSDPLIFPESERNRDRLRVKERWKGELRCKKWKDRVVVDRLINKPIKWAISGILSISNDLLKNYIFVSVAAVEWCSFPLEMLSLLSPLYHIVVIVRLMRVHKRSLTLCAFRCPSSLWLLVLWAMTIMFNPISGSPYMFWAGCVMRVKLLFLYVLIAWIGYLANNESVIQHNLYIHWAV